ncbi:MAG: hypothetical protein QOH32_1006 [Bradyrhizobium sp.]|jgi:hypothetical protein|nr:hypothetical protein [Bradyrhizobium sp.]
MDVASYLLNVAMLEVLERGTPVSPPQGGSAGHQWRRPVSWPERYQAGPGASTNRGCGTQPAAYRAARWTAGNPHPIASGYGAGLFWFVPGSTRALPRMGNSEPCFVLNRRNVLAPSTPHSS